MLYWDITRPDRFCIYRQWIIPHAKSNGPFFMLVRLQGLYPLHNWNGTAYVQLVTLTFCYKFVSIITRSKYAAILIHEVATQMGRLDFRPDTLVCRLDAAWTLKRGIGEFIFS